ncbi:MAG: UbiD family decarboxylase domain-containing protein [Granulosicoccus sp.]
MDCKDPLDLRSFLETVRQQSARECLDIDEQLDAHWEVAACTVGLENKLRVPIIKYTDVSGTDFPVVHNVCSSLPRIARAMGESAEQFEQRLSSAYDTLIPPVKQPTGPVRDVVLLADELDLYKLPNIRYTESETSSYISAACLVAKDPVSNVLNLSFHRLMILGKNQLAIYMTPGGHLHEIFTKNQLEGQDTPIAAFIGSHPLWSFGCLAAGSLQLDEYSVIGGLLGQPLEVVPALEDESLWVPAWAEFSLEGVIKHNVDALEGPYGEAFGYTSRKAERPVIEISSLSHRSNALFQDIVPGHLEHMIMTSTAIKVHLDRTLKAEYPWIGEVHLPAPMTAYVSAKRTATSDDVRTMIDNTLRRERFIKTISVFDDSVNISNAKETQKALAIHMQAHRDMVIVEGLTGNGLDPSEVDGLTTKWGVDATATAVKEGNANANALPAEVLQRIDINRILKRALDKANKSS